MAGPGGIVAGAQQGDAAGCGQDPGDVRVGSQGVQSSPHCGLRFSRNARLPSSASGESIEDACAVHGIDSKKLIDALNAHLAS